jgi:hypothetical protein
MLWTMVNALQALTTMPLLNVRLPAPVYLILINVARVDSMEILPPDDVNEVLFSDGFSET